MAKYTLDEILISNLELNTENPRFDMAGDQRQAIKVMLADQGPKILKLAEDIVEHGLNPSELTIVSPIKSAKGTFVVLEGNRRVTTLKLLSNPDLASIASVATVAKFKSLSKNYSELKKLPCVIFEDAEDAHRWIKLKHTGENDGIGTVRWDAQQVARFDERTGGTSAIALQVIDFLNKSEFADKKIKEELQKIPLTNLDRLITDKNVQDLLGISIQDGRLQTQIREDEIIKGLEKIIRDLISKRIKVKDIYTKKDRENYIEGFKRTEVPKKTEKAQTPWELVSPKQSITSQKPAKRSIPLATARKTLLPRDCILKIKNKRVNYVYVELKGLNCDDFTNAVAVLLRVFVELSSDSYIEKHKVKSLTKDSKLHSKITGIADEFEKNGTLKKDELKGIRTAVSNPNHILSTNTFNAYIHNKTYTPVSNDLKITWDNIQHFIEKIWESI